MRKRESNRAADVNFPSKLDQRAAQTESAIPEDVFHSLLTLERKRAERSRKQFVLMLMDAHLENGSAAGILKEAVEIVIASKRETDLIGWYRQGAILGVIFTEVNAGADRPITEILRNKFQTTLAERMGKSRSAKSRFLFTFSRKFGTRINPVGRRTANSIRNLVQQPLASRFRFLSNA